jgi:hypothetical protein
MGQDEVELVSEHESCIDGKLKIAFKNNNTLQKLLKPKLNSNIQQYDKSGIYKLTCNMCYNSYIGQINISFKQRFQEHNRYIRHNVPQSAYTGHI